METKDFQNLKPADAVNLAIANLAVNDVMGKDNGLSSTIKHISNLMDVCANLEAMKYLHYVAEAVACGIRNGKDHMFADMAGYGMSEIIFMNHLVSTNLPSIKIIGNFLADLYVLLQDKRDEREPENENQSEEDFQN